MTKLRGYIPTMLMLVTLMFGATAVHAEGIIIGGRTSVEADKNPCEEEKGVLDTVVDYAKAGIIIGGRMGIIIGGRTGIIIGGKSSQETCGIIIGGRTGIIIGG